jgi:uncharacterized membrane protein YfcA
MLSPKTWLLLTLVLVIVAFLVVWVRAGRQSPEPGGVPSFRESAIGFVTNFFDTLGIGSFAPTTSVFKLWRIVPDERIPGTLNVGHTLPTLAQALIYIVIVEVEFLTLVTLIGASVLGAWLGASVVCRWSRTRIQVGMGLALLAAATLFLMANLQLVPGGGEAVALRGPKLAIALAGNFTLGALMTLGIGLYAPCLIMISLLGMNPTAAFPIMMGSCAFLMPIASMRFVTSGAYSLRPAIGLALGGVPAVLLAAFIVKALPLTAVRWGIIVIVLVTAISMLRSAWGERKSGPAMAPAQTS